MFTDLTSQAFSRRRRCGFTLVELLTVLTILAAVGGMVVMTASSGMTVVDGAGQNITQQEVATRATLVEIEKALLGSGNQSGYHTHNLQLPTRIAGLLTDVDSLGAFDFATKRGWNGPYLLESGTRYEDVTEPGDADNFTSAYGNDADPVILDGWGRPIILQQPDTDDARLVSSGPNRLLETDPNDATNVDPDSDDLVRFLLTVDP